MQHTGVLSSSFIGSFRRVLARELAFQERIRRKQRHSMHHRQKVQLLEPRGGAEIFYDQSVVVTSWIRTIDKQKPT